MAIVPRGLRNNNPGNIDYNRSNDWQGQTGIETGVANPRFATFVSPEYGIRALAKILISYHRKGFNTVNEIINRYAPSVENNSRAYAQHVADLLDRDINAEFKQMGFDELSVLVPAIIAHEQGAQPYERAVIYRGINWALGFTDPKQGY